MSLHNIMISDFTYLHDYRESRAQCVFNQPNIGTKVERVLPGKIFSREEQCARLSNTGTCNVRMLDDEQTSTCDKLSCGCKISLTSVPVAEGTECGDGKVRMI